MLPATKEAVSLEHAPLWHGTGLGQGWTGHQSASVPDVHSEQASFGKEMTEPYDGAERRQKHTGFPWATFTVYRAYTSSGCFRSLDPRVKLCQSKVIGRTWLCSIALLRVPSKHGEALTLWWSADMAPAKKRRCHWYSATWAGQLICRPQVHVPFCFNNCHCGTKPRLQLFPTFPRFLCSSGLCTHAVSAPLPSPNRKYSQLLGCQED